MFGRSGVGVPSIGSRVYTNVQSNVNQSRYGGRRHKSWTCASKALTLLSEDSPGMKDPRVIF